MAGISITGIGSVTPVGLSGPASAAAFRASISRLTCLQAKEEHAPEGALPPPFGGRVPLEWFNGGPRIEEWPGHERFEVPIPAPEHLLIEDGADRLIKLAIPAAKEAWQQAGASAGQPQGWGLFLGLAVEEDATTKLSVVEALKSDLNNFQPVVTEVLAEGHAAGLAALHQASAAIASGRIAGALVGGVDSLIRPSTYLRLSAAGIVKGSVNARGILPGEAAAFLIIEKQPRNGQKLALIKCSSIAEEPTYGTDKPNQSQGLTKALRAVRTAESLTEMPLIICDMNGDRYRALEWSLALTRVFGNLRYKTEAPTSGEFWHPADCTGDMGAASGIVNCIWAVEAMRKGYAQLNRVLIWGASENRLRAAVILTSQN